MAWGKEGTERDEAFFIARAWGQIYHVNYDTKGYWFRTP